VRDPQHAGHGDVDLRLPVGRGGVEEPLALGRGRQVIKEGWATAFRARKQADRKPK